MKDNFEMSMMGEMKFFLRLQVHQSSRGIFISQSQYTLEILKKHGMDGCDSISTPMATVRINTDLQSTPTDLTKYRSMIGGLMYLTTSRPNITFATFVCARYQACPTEKYLKEQKKNVIQHPYFTKLIIADLMEKFESIPKILEEDYIQSKMIVRWDTKAYKDYEAKYAGVEVLMIQPEPNVVAVEKQMFEEDVENLVEGEEEFDGTEFAEMVLLSDEDFGDRLEPMSHKENTEKNDNDNDDDEKKDDKKDDDDDNDDHDCNTLILTNIAAEANLGYYFIV
ncbi:retrovirus-related pol polyprotein from transposon TNT 1-94 [Tanacetum coccineum]